MNMKKKNEQYHHKNSISNSNARSMNNFLNTEPLTQSQKNQLVGPGDQSQPQLNALGQGQPSVEQMKQFEDRKKVVASIYLNTMSGKIPNVDARERQRRRQSDSGVLNKTGGSDHQESGGAVRSSGAGGGSLNRSQLYGVEKSSSSNYRPINKFRQEYISKRNGRGG